MSKKNIKKDKLKDLRLKLTELRKERESIIFEKGLLAQDNKDLRENFAFMQYEQKEHAITAKIHAIMNDIYELTKK